MTTVPLPWYLGLAALLFTLGTLAVLVRRSTLVVLMGIELMLNAVNLTLVTHAHRYADPHGVLLAMLVMIVAAAEAAVALAIVLAMFRWRGTAAEPAQVGRIFRTTHLRSYALSFVLGVVFILWYLVAV